MIVYLLFFLSVLLILAWILEGDSINGPWFQMLGATILILVGLHDLIKEKTKDGKLKGVSVFLCSMILLIPTIKTTLAG